MAKKKDFKIEIGKWLRSKRSAAFLTQGEVSDRLGFTSPQFISNWERGLALPPREIIPYLIDLYKLQPEEIIELFLENERQDLEFHVHSKPKRRYRS